MESYLPALEGERKTDSNWESTLRRLVQAEIHFSNLIRVCIFEVPNPYGSVDTESKGRKASVTESACHATFQYH